MIVRVRLLVLAIHILPQTVRAQKTLAPEGGRREPRARSETGTRRYFSLSGFATIYQNPFLREPQVEGVSSGELQTRQEVNIGGGRLGVGLMAGRIGGEVGFTYWTPARVQDFDYYNPESYPDTTRYSDVTVGLIAFDMLLLVAPVERLPLHVFGVLGMGQTRKHYTVSGSGFAEHNGRREINEFGYSGGFGVRLSPLRNVALFGEFRWVPGDHSTTIPQDGCYVYVSRRGPAAVSASVRGTRAAQIDDCKTNTDFGRLLTAGLTISL